MSAVCEGLRESEHILLIGHGKGHSNATTSLVNYIEDHEPELQGKIAGTLELDIPAMSDAEILQEARTFFRAASQRGL